MLQVLHLKGANSERRKFQDKKLREPFYLIYCIAPERSVLRDRGILPLILNLSPKIWLKQQFSSYKILKKNPGKYYFKFFNYRELCFTLYVGIAILQWGILPVLVRVRHSEQHCAIPNQCPKTRVHSAREIVCISAYFSKQISK